MPLDPERLTPAELRDKADPRGRELTERMIRNLQAASDGAANATSWLLVCGHSVPMLEHDEREHLPDRPRMCPVCRQPRIVSAVDY